MTRIARSSRAAVIAPVSLRGVLGRDAGAAAATERCRAARALEPGRALFRPRPPRRCDRQRGGVQDFVAGVVTPLFPDGLGVDVAGQFRDGAGTIIREPSKLLILLVPDAAEVARPTSRPIVGACKERFDQQSVLHTEQPVCIALD